jgi:phosphomannomutase
MLSKIFKAYDVRGIYPDPLGEADARRIGCAPGRFLKAQVGKYAATPMRADAVVVSRDMRPSSDALAGALIDGLRAASMNVIDLGMCDTSIIYFAVNHLDAAGGIQTTASHNPIEYNGFKISGQQARPIGAESGLDDIREMADALGKPGSIPATGSVESLDVWDAYRGHILEFYRPGGRKLKVFIDASNGMAGKLVPRVFDGVEGIEIVPLNFEITGSFVHEPNPLVAENMAPTQAGVLEHGADLGACFDGDADRCMFVDDRGRIIGCDHLTALLCDHFVKQSPGTTIVYDLRSSKAVEQAIRACGAVPRKSRVGHVFMKAALRETDGAFGGELSGHFYFRDNFFADSGAIVFAALASVLSATDRPLGEMISPFQKYPQSGEINFQVADKDAVLAALKQTYSDAQIDELDGVTIDSFDEHGWWFNVRASNTEPLLRLNAEAADQTALDTLLDELRPMLGTPVSGH